MDGETEEAVGQENENESEPEPEEQQDTVETLSGELAALREEVAEAGKVKEQLAKAVSKYRLAVLAAAPDVPEEMVKGETVEEIDESLAVARGLVARVRQQLESEVAGRKVPAGAPPRTPPDLSALSPEEKIAYALGRRQG